MEMIDCPPGRAHGGNGWNLTFRAAWFLRNRARLLKDKCRTILVNVLSKYANHQSNAINLRSALRCILHHRRFDCPPDYAAVPVLGEPLSLLTLAGLAAVTLGAVLGARAAPGGGPAR